MMAVDGHDGDRRTLQTSPTPVIKDWGVLMFDDRTPLLHIEDHLTADCYVTRVMELVFLHLLQCSPNTVLQKDYDRPHRRTLNSRTGFSNLSWLVISPDLNTVEHLSDLIGRHMN
ncbi:transposable element Tcb1 transposase [Trichonephila clavipes]|nr:transposable element Tcb1 transposase [Trichonephila clavipes]